ncbi:MAG TPA: hypothetical protein VFB94_11230, partial [Acidimicrobiales bacterium]|nr:hypothetical protein [Acidimicrobiales bacterium]
MSPDDRSDDMLADRDADFAFEVVLDGRDPGDEHRALAMLADDLRVVTGGPPPIPSRALATVLAGTPARPRRRRRARATSRAGRWNRAARVAGGAAAAVTGLAGAAAVGALPSPVVDAMRPVVELVTPFDLSRDPHDHDPAPSDAPDRGDPAPPTRSPDSPTTATSAPSSGDGTFPEGLPAAGTPPAHGQSGTPPGQSGQP